MINAHIDYQTKTIDGVTFTNTHRGQKHAYGDSYYEYNVTSDLEPEEVEKVCRESVYKAIPHAEWQEDYRKPGCSMGDAFRPHYQFKRLGVDRYSYIVTCLYTD